MLSLLFTAASFAFAADLSVPCINASKTASVCCQNPLTHVEECLTPEAKALNKKLQAFQESISKPSGGLKDTTRERQAQLQARNDSASLNTNLAQQCETLATACLTSCSSLTSSDAKAAAAHCQEEAKAAEGFRAQAERDSSLVKRGRRAK